MLAPDGELLLVSVPAPVPVVPEEELEPGELEPGELLPEYGEVLEGLDPVVPEELVPVPVLPLLVSELVPVLLVSVLLPVLPMPVLPLPLLVSVLLPVLLVSLLLPVPPIVDDPLVEPVPLEVLPLVSELLPVPPSVDEPLVPAPPPVAVLGAVWVLSAPLPAPPTVDDGPVPVVEVPEEPVPIELGSFVIEPDVPVLLPLPSVFPLLPDPVDELPPALPLELPAPLCA